MPTKSFVSMLRYKMLALTQGELAERMDVTQATISTWETGKSIPQRRQWVMLKRLAEEHEQRQRDREEGR